MWEQEHLGLHSYHPCFTPLSIRSSFEWCYQQGALIETRHNFQTRVNLATIGLAIIQDPQDDQNVILLTMNSMGDLYHQTLSPKTGALRYSTDANFLAKMRQTGVQLVARQDAQSVLTLTGCFNLKSLFVDAVYDDAVEEAGIEETHLERQDRLRRMMRKAKWNRPVGRLRKYKDVLSQDLLAVWDVSDEDDDEKGDIDEEVEHMVRSMAPAEKVNAWLHSTQVHQDLDVDFSMDMGSSSKCGAVQKPVELPRGRTSQEKSDLFLDVSAVPETATQQHKVAAKKRRVLGF